MGVESHHYLRCPSWLTGPSELVVVAGLDGFCLTEMAFPAWLVSGVIGGVVGGLSVPAVKRPRARGWLWCDGVVDALSSVERAVVRWAGQLAAVNRANVGPGSAVAGWRYCSVGELLLDRGRLFTPGPVLDEGELGPMKACFRNAAARADACDEVYVEGLASTPSLAALSVEHAWCAAGAGTGRWRWIPHGEMAVRIWAWRSWTISGVAGTRVRGCGRCCGRRQRWTCCVMGCRLTRWPPRWAGHFRLS